MRNKSKKEKEIINKKNATKIGQKQSQKKRKQQKKEKRIQKIEEKERQKIEEQKRQQQILKKAEIERRKLETIQRIDQRIKAKREERLEFLASLGNGYKENAKTINHAKRVDAEIADKKRQEEYLKAIDNNANIHQISPKLKTNKYASSDEKKDRIKCKGVWR